ncbi:MAG: hypothetical protein L0J72_07760, partial [Lacticaseibacillus paracasei]|nr:hypothetical protein [Lacticaseibacillus paracasei]
CVSLSNMKLKSVEPPTSNGGRLIFVHKIISHSEAVETRFNSLLLDASRFASQRGQKGDKKGAGTDA